MAVVGVLMALIELSRTGKGQVVEVDMASRQSFAIENRADRVGAGNRDSIHFLLPSPHVATIYRSTDVGPTSRIQLARLWSAMVRRLRDE